MTSLFGSENDYQTPPDVISKSAFAQEIGVSKPRVSQLVKEGLPVTANGKIDRAVALAWYQKNIEPNRRKAFADKSSGDAKSQLDHIKIERERLALSKERGELIDRRAAQKAVFERARAERDAWLSWSSRMSAQLATELGTDPATLYAVLDREVRAQIAELADKSVENLNAD